MNAIELMMKEHEYIRRMILVVRKACYKLTSENDISYDDFYKMVDFIREYADKNHHGKEEVMLFNRMMDEIGATAEKLVKHGMLVEHDLGRLYITELTSALEDLKSGNDEAKIDVIGSAISYTNLLTRHMEKEDGVIYKFAARQLKPETIEALNKECAEFEEEDKFDRQKYLNILEELEKKYL